MTNAKAETLKKFFLITFKLLDEIKLVGLIGLTGNIARGIRDGGCDPVDALERNVYKYRLNWYGKNTLLWVVAITPLI